LKDSVPDILARIVATKRDEVARTLPLRGRLEEQAERRRADRRDFRAALVRLEPALIAEIKKASPSKGLIAGTFDPAGTARAYQAGGAAALSVLTDVTYFQGGLADLETARAAVRLPALRKDFTIDRVQIVEAAAHGADAILLIAAILTEKELRDFREAAASYGMAALVEVHHESELAAAIGSGADIIGVNNRDLTTFEVTLETSLRLAGRMPRGAVRVAESGIHGPEDVRRLREAGFQAFLVGEYLMKSSDPAAALAALVGYAG
jgi:indole-3-glycerol phosphate synthase